MSTDDPATILARRKSMKREPENVERRRSAWPSTHSRWRQVG